DIVFHRPPGRERYYTIGFGLGTLSSDVDVPRARRYADSAGSPPGLWIGQSGNLTPLHYDCFHGFLVQVRGHKRVTLLAPDESANLPVASPFGSRMCQTELPPDCLRADSARHSN